MSTTATKNYNQGQGSRAYQQPGFFAAERRGKSPSESELFYGKTQALHTVSLEIRNEL